MHIESAAISVVVTTFNEEVNLDQCLKTVTGWAKEIFVVDSFSNDRTEEIARRYTRQFVQHQYENHPAQWDWALKHLPLTTGWVFALDADFRVTEELKQALSTTIPTLRETTTGIYVRHRQLFRGRFIRNGTMYPRYWLRLFRPGSVFIDKSDLVDLHFYVNGKTMNIEHDIIEDNLKERNLSFWITKQVHFAERAAVEEVGRRRSGEAAPVRPSLLGTPDQRTLWLKSHWYYLPLYWRSVAYFLYRYFIRLGFLDGREGFLYHFTQALLYRIMVDARIEELRHSETASVGLPINVESRRSNAVTDTNQDPQP
jgi:glycosyltransferase involved in cell wall biosynthesis